jgi:hypothetical protein
MGYAVAQIAKPLLRQGPLHTRPMADVGQHDPELSLIRGGPLYRAQLATKVIHPDRWDAARRVVIAVAIGWLPLVLITAALNPTGLSSLLLDYRVAARLLIAIPALLVGQVLTDSLFRMVVEHLTIAGLLDATDVPRMQDTIRRIRKLRDSVLPEVVILLLVILHTAVTESSYVDATPWLTAQTGGALRLTVAGWYAMLVSASLFQFLVGLGLWRWLLWSFFALRLSRLNLKLSAAHPDRNGGLGFLGMTPAAVGPVVFAACLAIGSTWRHEILTGHANLWAFKLPAIVLLLTIALIAAAPLAFFVPRLVALRHQGTLEYGILAQLHSQQFEDKWIRHRTASESEFLAAPDSIGLFAFGEAYDKLKRLVPFPLDMPTLIGVALCAVVPMLPALLAVVPLGIVFKTLFEALR